MDEDIDYNPFYQALQNCLWSMYQRAQERRYTVCLPHSSCISKQDITTRFAEMHILKSSPYFQGQLCTTDPGNTRTLLVERGYLVTGDGFKEGGRRIKIISEEIGYNAVYKSYRILLLEEPVWTIASDIEGAPRRKSLTPRKMAVADPLLIKIDFQDNKQFLESFNENKKALSNLDHKILQFQQNYVILQRYLNEAAVRLKEIWSEGFSDIMSASLHPLRGDCRFGDTVCSAVESYVMGHLHEKVMPVICQVYKDKDKALSEKLSLLKGVNPRQLGVPDALCCPLDAAVLEIDRLSGLATPLEKMSCLKTMLDVVSETVVSHASKHAMLSKGEPPCITSDELIPLIVCVLAESNVTTLESNMYYIENFNWSSSSTDDLSFSFVTFQAAVQYVKSNNLSTKTTNIGNGNPVLPSSELHTSSPVLTSRSSGLHTGSPELRHRSPEIRSSSSINGSIKNTDPELQKLTRDADLPQESKPSRLDRQMERINKMLASTSVESTSRLTNPSSRSSNYSSRGYNAPRSPSSYIKRGDLWRTGADSSSTRSFNNEIESGAVCGKGSGNLWGMGIGSGTGTRKDNNLGDFLSSLQDDTMHGVYGKGSKNSSALSKFC